MDMLNRTSEITRRFRLRLCWRSRRRRASLDSTLAKLLADESIEVRKRATLAAGRIGDERAVASLIPLLEKDSDKSVRAMAAFALGEIESATAIEALLAELRKGREPLVQARAVEALGKIAAALPKSEEATAKPVRSAILSVLELEAGRRRADEEVVMLA
jgi:HEAT repeat protein